MIVFSGDGKRFATAGSGPVHLWDAATLTAVATETGFQGRINALAFSPDGRTFAAASHDGTSREWTSDTGQEVVILRGHGKQVVDLAYLGNGKVLATLSWDRSLQIWDVNSATELFHSPVEHVELRNPDDPNSASVDQSEGHSIHDYDWVGILKAIDLLRGAAFLVNRHDSLLEVHTGLDGTIVSKAPSAPPALPRVSDLAERQNVFFLLENCRSPLGKHRAGLGFVFSKLQVSALPAVPLRSHLPRLLLRLQPSRKWARR